MFTSGKILMTTLLALALALTGQLAHADSPPSKLWTEKSSAQPLDPDAPVRMSAFADLAKELSPAVINISVTRAGQRTQHPMAPFFGPGGSPHGQSVGSGFIIHKDGYALSNHHVIDGANAIQVKTINDEVYDAEIVGSYPELDVALLKIKADKPLKVAALGNSGQLQIGEWVIAIGNPFGLNHTVTAGIVSAKGRRDINPGGAPTYANFIQTDASINPGNSGGPLINIRGEVIGINTAINAAGQGIGFAVPMDMIKKILPQLAKGRVSRSYLGVKIGAVTREFAQRLGLDKPFGALVREVQPNTPAASAGVRAGDVITHWAGRRLDHWEDLPWLASTAGIGRPVDVKVRRGGKTLELKVKLSTYPGEQPAAASAGPGKQPSGVLMEEIGLSLAALPAKQARRLGVAPSEAVLVREVERGSSAEQAGLEPGDVILQVNYEAIEGGIKGFKKLIGEVARGQVLSFLIRRGDRQIFVAFTK